MKLQRKSKKVRIRPLELTDYKAWREAYLTMSSLPRNQWDHLAKKEKNELNQKDFKKFIKQRKENFKKDEIYNFGIFLNDGAYVGTVSLMDISRGLFQNAYIGYSIFNNHWGKGYGKEAIKLAIDIAFRDLNLHRVEAGIHPKNKRSIGLAKFAGLKKEGVSKKRLYIDNKWIDLYLYAATSETFSIRWKPRK